MMDPSPIIHSVTDGGVAATHLPFSPSPTLVAAAASGKDHNTIRNALVPFACWRAHDMRFKFDSSFVLPEIQEEIRALKELIDKNTIKDDAGKPGLKPVLTVFGHADPVGSDDYNKTLSGKRAQAIYGMLVRNVDLWDDFYKNPQGNDKWEPEVIHEMQSELNQPLTNNPSVSARKALYKAYMDRICTIQDDNDQPILDDSGQPVRLELAPADFLAGGADKAGGKGDYQGCGEFNPVLLFSDSENKDFADPKKKELRDAANEPNRRVLIFLFRPGTRIDPKSWPCPGAKEGVEGCKKRFWSDGDKRRNTRLPDKERRYSETKDTFACRFYDRLNNNSPCESLDRTLFSHISVLLRSNSGAVPLAKVNYKIKVNEGRTLTGVTDKNGLIKHSHIPPGDYPIELEGKPMDTLVPTLPVHIAPCELRVPDFFLFDEIATDLPPITDSGEVVVHKEELGGGFELA